MDHPAIQRHRFRTLDDVRTIARMVAERCPNPDAVLAGLSELMINAVEHGNLGITYEDKTRLVRDGRWLDEVERRLQLPDQAVRFAELVFESQPDYLSITISDAGGGFDWRPFLSFQPERTVDPHGRGIALAQASGFCTMEYQGSGNVVVCKIFL